MKLLDSNRYHLRGTNGRWMHLATVQDNLREYMCFVDLHTQQVYIEEVTGGHLERIEDDVLAQHLEHFLRRHGILDVGRPTIPDDQWLRGKTQ